MSKFVLGRQRKHDHRKKKSWSLNDFKTVVEHMSEVAKQLEKAEALPSGAGVNRIIELVDGLKHPTLTLKCCLCNQPVVPDYTSKYIFFNRKNVLVHKTCPGLKPIEAPNA